MYAVFVVEGVLNKLESDIFFFFFKQKTAYEMRISDWSSDVCSSDLRRFLMNPRWRHFARVKASELLLLDADDQETMSRPNAPDASAWCIHGAIHRAKPAARVLLHCHPPYATALATLKDPAMKPIDQNTARFFDLVSYDLGFGGIADDTEEGTRLAAALGDKPVMLMGSHGVTCTAPTVAEIGRASCRERVCQYV